MKNIHIKNVIMLNMSSFKIEEKLKIHAQENKEHHRNNYKCYFKVTALFERNCV